MPVKSGRWATNRTEVAPQFQRLWDKLDLALPLFGSVSDVVNGLTVSLETDWQFRNESMGIALNANGNQDSLTIAGYSPPEYADRPFAAAVVVDNLDATQATSSSLLSTRESSQTGWALKAEQWEDLGNVGFTKFGSGNIDSGIVTPTGPSIIACSVRENAMVNIWVVDLSTGTISSHGPSNSNTWNPGTGLALGGNPSDVGEDPLIGDMFAVYVWRRAITDDDVELLALDPFGPIRPAPLAFPSFIKEALTTKPLLVPARPVKPGRW